jgi:hypothetical protein
LPLALLQPPQERISVHEAHLPLRQGDRGKTNSPSNAIPS